MKKRFRLTGPQIMVLGFAGVILLGTLLLLLPFATASGKSASFVDSLFTSTTSVCVTGLVVQETATYWSDFGHGVILVLIQIGGLGVITMAASFALLAGRKIGLFQRSAMQEAVSAHKMGGVVKLTVFLLKLTFAIEAVGALILAPTMIGDFGWGRGIWNAVFTSISAFCNAGIEMFGIGDRPSLTGYVGNPVVNITLMALIITGGLGFLTWDDIRSHGVHLRRYRMQSKVILLTTAVLIFLPAVWLFFEFSELPMQERTFAALFQSVTTRTAGFSSVDLNTVSQPGQMMMTGLMLIGAAPGSTGGGMKVTTIAVLVGCVYAVFRKRESTQFFGRRIAQDVVSTALTIFVLYLFLSTVAAMIISAIEDIPLLTCLFETASAVSTAGLSLGITGQLSAVSKTLLVLLMYLGRVGGLTLIFAALNGAKRQVGKLPLDHITVG